jgi:hypothetical protein
LNDGTSRPFNKVVQSDNDGGKAVIRIAHSIDVRHSGPDDVMGIGVGVSDVNEWLVTIDLAQPRE